MSLVVLDIECNENNTVKELGIYKDRHTVEYSFPSPEKFKPTSQFFGVHSFFMELIGQWLRKIY